MHKLLLFGGSGQIGSRIIDLLSKDIEIVAPSHAQVDLKDKDAIGDLVNQTQPDFILHAAGFTSIDKAPENPYEAFMANAGTMFYLTSASNKHRVPFYYLSTDIVFNGKQTDRPYKEDVAPDPLSLNAKFKRVGELVTLDANSRNGVIRLIVCYSSFFDKRSDLARMALNKVRSGEHFSATNDQNINPVYVDDLVNAIKIILEKKASGIYHVGATTYTTPFDFARRVVKSFGLDENLILPTTFEEFSKVRPEPRPQHEWLDTSKFRKEFGEGILHSVEDGIELFKQNLENLS